MSVDPKSDRRRVAYDASALGIGGRITRIKAKKEFILPWPHSEEVDYQIPGQAAANVPVNGGLSISVAGPYEFSIQRPHPTKILSIGGAVARGLGGLGRDDPHSSQVEAHVWDLNVLDRIKANYVAVRLRSSYKNDKPLENPNATPELLPDYAEIDGLMFDGRVIPVTVNYRPYREHPTFDSFFKALPDMVKGLPARNQFIAAGERTEEVLRKARAFREKPSYDSVMPCIHVASIVEPINQDKLPRGVRVGSRPWSVILDDVGELFLGEVILGLDSRRITMIRGELGCDFSGSLDCVDTRGNTRPT